MCAKNIDQKCVETIRFLAADAVQKANSGHPGMPVGMAPAAYTLWTKIMRHNPANPQWLNRDRFVLSAGHGSTLIYSMLHLCGYDMSLEDLKGFRQWGSKTPGHPEYGKTPRYRSNHRPAGPGRIQCRRHGAWLRSIWPAALTVRDSRSLITMTYAICRRRLSAGRCYLRGLFTGRPSGAGQCRGDL